MLWVTLNWILNLQEDENIIHDRLAKSEFFCLSVAVFFILLIRCVLNWHYFAYEMCTVLCLLLIYTVFKKIVTVAYSNFYHLFLVVEL